jgi:uncharacterized repeat protein (TIGR01451 family)
MTHRLALPSLVLLATTLALAPQPARADRAAPLPTLQGEAARAYLWREGLDGPLAAALTVAAAPLFTQQAYLKASNTGENDQFGNSVAISGDTVVVGALQEDSNATGVDGDPANDSAVDSGAAYVFVRSAGGWSQQAYLKGSNTDAGDRFGSSVAILGDTIVVGAEGAGVGGAVYVFVRSAGAWSQQAHLPAPLDPGVQGFGYSVAISGDTLVAGASNRGAYVFVRNAGAWSRQARLTASNPGDQDLFGRSVGISGDTVVVGALGEDSDATGVDGDPANDAAVDSGAAYVFVRNAGAWSQQAYLKASNTGAGDFFGSSVAISGDTILVGALFEDSDAAGVNGDPSNDSLTDSGAAYLFVRSAGVWSQQAYLKPSNPSVGAFFGFSAATEGDTLVVTSVREFFNDGAAYTFVRRAGVWSQLAILRASNADVPDWFGYSVAISGGTLVVGARFEDSNATGVDGDPNNAAVNAGAAYVFVASGADVEMAKAADVSDPDPGDTVVFTLTATNQGPAGATGVTVTDTLPAGLTYGSNDCGAAFASPALIWTIGNLADSSSAVCHLAVTVDAGASGTIVNTAAVTANEEDPDPGDNDASATLTVTVADLEIQKTADNPTPVPGGTVVFTLTATNQGPSAATGVTVTDTLPAGLTYASNDCGAAFASPTLTWTISALANLASATCHLTVTVDAGASGTIVNSAAVHGNEFDPQTGDNDDDATLTVTVADLQIQKTADNVTPVPGGTVVFTLTATNQGPSAATGVTVTDTLPAGLTYGSNDCGAAFASPKLTWTIGALANLASATCHLTVTINVGASGTIVNTAAVDGNEFDPQIGNNDDDATLTIDLTGYYTLPPCRLVDTRLADGPLGGPALAANVARDFVLAGACGVPADAVAVVLISTAVAPTAAGGLQIYAAGGTPLADGGIVHYGAGVTRASNGIVVLGAGGAVSALAEQPAGTVHLVLDVAGYFR